MRVTLTDAEALGRLLSWDAPCLPLIKDVTASDTEMSISFVASGATLAQVERWPKKERSVVVLQLLAATVFLYERGWYPSRRILRSARVERDSHGIWLRFSELPRHRLDDDVVLGRMATALRHGDDVLIRLLTPLLTMLLPELALEFTKVRGASLAWQATSAYLAVLAGGKSGSHALSHPTGSGRALWSRRFHLPRRGVFWVEEEDLFPGLEAAIRLHNSSRGTRVKSGMLEEADVARVEAQVAAEEADCVVFTTLPLAGVEPLPLAEGGESLWLFAQSGDHAAEYHARAIEVGSHRPILARAILAAGAASAFIDKPQTTSLPSQREVLASPPARMTLTWLSASPLGLTVEELSCLGKNLEGNLSELERLRLARRHGKHWHAVQQHTDISVEKMQILIDRLPPTSPVSLLARGLSLQQWQPCLAWCEDQFVGGHAEEVVALTMAAPTQPTLALAGTEAALNFGRLAEAEARLAMIEAPYRGAIWHLLKAWQAKQAGLTAVAREELELVGNELLPDRLACRRALLKAALARLDREGQLAESALADAVRIAPFWMAEASIERAAQVGTHALRMLGHAQGRSWSGEIKTLFLHLLGMVAWENGEYRVAATILRAALRAATGNNPRLLGEIHSDLGGLALVTEQPVVADRHFLLAERLLDGIGSRRAVTTVRHNRAVIACDRMDWRQARDLILKARQERVGDQGAAWWLEECELVRTDMARGDVVSVRAALPQLTAGVARFQSHLILQQSLADLRCHLALAVGDLHLAGQLMTEAEEGEQSLVQAVLRGARGEQPSDGLPIRWGVSITAGLLAGWHGRDGSGVLRQWETSFARTPREASVGLARFHVIVSRDGIRLSPEWETALAKAEPILEAAELGGWLVGLRGPSGLDPAQVVRAIDGIISAGTDALAEPRLQALARSLGLAWFAIEWNGRRLASFCAPEKNEEVHANGAFLFHAPAISPTARAAFDLISRQLASSLEAALSMEGRRFHSALSANPGLAIVRDAVEKYAALPLNVLILGEPGTGKELIARELHSASGRKGPLVTVNCAGMPGTLLEAELFGASRGAYTGADRDRKGLAETAEGGTLFLDEVGELPLELQGKFLRLLQEHEVRPVGSTQTRTIDVRFIAATNRNLKESISQGFFRQDLYYRLAVVVIEVPPLRERRGDVPIIAGELLGKWAIKCGRPGVRLSPAALELLQQHDWPGNVRELETMIQLALGGAKPGESLGPDRFPQLETKLEKRPLLSWASAGEALRQGYFAHLLEECGGNRSLAARKAGLSRQTLLYHLRELGIGRKQND